MTKENYQNGDIHWNTYTGVFKAYDKDGNEVKFPTDNLSYGVKFENVERDKTMDKEFIENPVIAYKKLKEENEALVKENEDMKKSFVSHSEFMDILENNPNINWETTAKDNIYLANKYCKALKEIRELNLFSLNNSREKIAKINEIVSEALK